MVRAAMFRRLVVIVAMAVGGPAWAADLPRYSSYHPLHRHHHAGLVPRTRIMKVLPPRPVQPFIDGLLYGFARPCAPGYAENEADMCRRHGPLHVACDSHGSGCRPLPPDPLPYRIGPYMRLAY